MEWATPLATVPTAWVVPAGPRSRLSALLVDLKTAPIGQYSGRGRVRSHAYQQNQGIPGRQHWPHAIRPSSPVAGFAAEWCTASRTKSGVSEGQAGPAARFCATIYHALGVPFESRITKDGLSRPLSTGEPILDLFA